MWTTLQQFCQDESGMLISAELTIIVTVSVLAMVVGLNEGASAFNAELNDISNAVGSLNQSFGYNGFRGCTSGVPGSQFLDQTDACDISPLVLGLGNTGEVGLGTGYEEGY